MRLIVLAIAVLLRAIPLAQAQESPSPDALNAARELMAVMSPDMVGQMTQGMTAQIWPQIEASLRGKIDEATSSELRAEFEQSLRDFVNEGMKEAPAIYARYFTAAELREIAAFYKTPTGAKSLQAMPKVMADSFGLMAPRMASFQQDIQARMLAILQRHGYQQR
jgi:hypothetical protein